jgi:hypothetical protein
LYHPPVTSSSSVLTKSTNKAHHSSTNCKRVLTQPAGQSRGYFAPAWRFSSASWCTHSSTPASTGTGRTAPWCRRYSTDKAASRESPV